MDNKELIERLRARGRDHICEVAADAFERAEAELAKYRSAEVVGWMFQHEETGNVFMVDVQQVEWGYERLNPRHQKIAQLIIRPEAP